TTGNKSEIAVGYATLYGDMCGGFNLLNDLYKTQIYALANSRNTQSDIIPASILTKARTAELRDNQTDQDSLPPYELLDRILHGLIEQQRSPQEIAADGIDLPLIRQIEILLRRAEYKRRQAAPGVKLSSLSFGRDHRYPITAH